MYYIMNVGHASPLWEVNPHCVHYDSRKLVLSGVEPKNFQGEIVPLYEQGLDATGDDGLTHAQLTALVDQMRAAAPTGKLIQLSKAQGTWLYHNHEAFKPVEVE